MAVGEICTRQVVIAEKSNTVKEAVQLMRNYHVGDVMVVEAREGHNYPVGIVTDRDIVVAVVAAGVEPDAVTVGEIMGPELATVQENEGLYETIHTMRAKRVRRMPVVDREGGLLGIVTLDDLLNLLAGEMTEMAKLVSRERQRETSARP
ncbi:MAG: CBS domain-containing protein [Thiobacillus sp.]